MTVLDAVGLAAYLGISESSAYKILESGQLPTIRIGTSIRVIAEELDEYLCKHRSLYIRASGNNPKGGRNGL